MTDQGFPDWTELGQDSGLDPLGMQRPIEAIYQSLIPGISTITLRYRYYSFFPLILRHYEKNICNADPVAFRAFQRRCEALYALICTYGDRELGVTGSDWAADILAEVAAREGENGSVDFRQAADPNAHEDLRYLKNKGGAFGAIYSTQMREMGLLHFPGKGDPNPNPVCSTLALEVAEALEQELGDIARRFFAAVDEGQVSLSSLASLGAMKPSRLLPGSQEHTLLTNVLLGKASQPSAVDLMRRSTLLMLLETVDTLGSLPAADVVKWHWHDAEASSSPAHLNGAPALWSLYQACDLTRLAYESILSAALTILAAAPGRRMPLTTLVQQLTEYADIPEQETWQEFSESVGRKRISMKGCAAAMLSAVGKGEPEEQVKHAIRLLALLCEEARASSAVAEQALSGADYFQSLRTEAQYLETKANRPAREAVADLIAARVLKRHLWVASRKFRNQKAYTFHMEPEDGVLRYRSDFQVSPSSPRIDQALRFLRDASLVDEQGLTAHGRAALVAA